MVSPRSTSPPKSACPGVSTMFIFTPPKRTEVFFARIVMPFSRSRSPESRTRSVSCLVRPEGTRLTEHGVDESRLAVVDMGNDRHIAYVVPGLHAATLLPAGTPSARAVTVTVR